MDPRHNVKRIREAARLAREERRAAEGRQRNATLLATVEGGLCAVALAGQYVDAYILAIAKDYLNKGLRVSPRLRELIDRILDVGYIEPGEERELVLDMLAGAVGLLPAPEKSRAYYLMESKRDEFLAFVDHEWSQVTDLLNQALGRGAYKFFADSLLTKGTKHI